MAIETRGLAFDHVPQNAAALRGLGVSGGCDAADKCDAGKTSHNTSDHSHQNPPLPRASAAHLGLSASPFRLTERYFLTVESSRLRIREFNAGAADSRQRSLIDCVAENRNALSRNERTPSAISAEVDN